MPACYRRAQRILARAGLRRDATTSARDFAAAVELRLPIEAASAFEAITDHYLAERFGEASPVDLRPELRALEDAVDRMGLGNQAHVR